MLPLLLALDHGTHLSDIFSLCTVAHLLKDSHGNVNKEFLEMHQKHLNEWPNFPPN